METRCECGGRFEEFFFGVVPGVSRCERCGRQAPLKKDRLNHDLAVRVQNAKPSDSDLLNAVVK